MSKLFKQLSRNVILLLLFTSIGTECMRFKNLKITPARIKHYSSHTTNPIPPQCTKQPIALEYEYIDWQSPTNTFQKLENAKEALTGEDWPTQDAARDFLIDCIEKKQNLELIAEIAKKAWRTPPKRTSSVWHTQRSVLQIYKALTQQNNAREFGMNIASMVTINTWGISSDLGRDIFTNLLNNNYTPAFETATTAAAIACREKDDLQIRNNGLKLFEVLFKVEYKPAFEEATKTAQDLTHYKDDHAKLLAIKLLNAIDKRKQTSAEMDASRSSIIKKPITWGPLKNFIPSDKITSPHITPEEWSSYEKCETISADDFLYGLKKLEKLHKAHDDNKD